MSKSCPIIGYERKQYCRIIVLPYYKERDKTIIQHIIVHNDLLQFLKANRDRLLAIILL